MLRDLLRCVLLALLLESTSASELVLVDASEWNAKTASRLKREGFQGVVLVMDDKTAVQQISDARLQLFYWIEVGRNAELAKAHPEWMGSIGMHDDWRKRFPEAPAVGKSQVAKAYPWVPITAKDAFEAHLKRVTELLRRAPANYDGILLNDLQGPPSSCGCGNLQCRWAVDYHVPATAKQLSPDDAAARFVAEVRKLAPGKRIIPVWTTECEEQDLPQNRRPDKNSTGYCGTVGCAVGTCPKEFRKQWAALVKESSGPIGLLTLSQAFQRQPEWIERSLNYLEATITQSVSRSNLWVVVQGRSPKEERAARDLAARLGVGATIVARVQIDQSYSPRVIAATSGAEKD